MEDKSDQTEELLRSALDENNNQQQHLIIPEIQIADDNIMAEDADSMGPSNFQFFPQCLS